MPKFSRTWRRCVIHYAEHHQLGGFKGWKRLDSGETEWSIDLEIYPWPSQPYSCLHCNEFQEKRAARSWRDLLFHVRGSHRRGAPVRGVVDFTIHPRPVNLKFTTGGILELGHTLSCRHCMKNRGKSKNFDHTGLASHVKAVHLAHTVTQSDYIEVS